MKKQITIVSFLFLALVLVAGGCKNKDESNESETNQIKEQKQEKVEVDNNEIDNNIEVESTKSLAQEAKEEYEQARERNKDCRQYAWSNMNEGPYRDKVSFATSTDLLNWEDSEQILAEHASVPGAIMKDGTIYVYHVDVSESCYAESLGLIKSEDNGETWSESERVYIKGLSDKVAVDPAPYLLEDGSIRLYYFDINGDKNPSADFKIYSAVSSDGKNFEEEEGIRFSNPGTLDPDVIKVGDTWRLYAGAIESNSTISATSNDGLNFTYEGVAYQGGAVPDVFYKDGTYYLYTAGIDVATSSDGVKFTRTNGHFQSNLGMVTADPSVIELTDGTYLMMYKTSEGIMH